MCYKSTDWLINNMKINMNYSTVKFRIISLQFLYAEYPPPRLVELKPDSY